MKLALIVALAAAPSGCRVPDAVDDAPRVTRELGPNEYVVEPREVGREALDASTFDPSWFLPDLRTDGGDDLVQRMRRLASSTFERRRDGRVERFRFADLVRELRPLGPEARDAALARLATEAPAFTDAWGAAVRELVLDDFLTGDDWKPSRNSPRDGILFGDSWEVWKQDDLSWPNKGEKPRLEQAAALFFADFASIKEVEADCRVYPRNVGADYDYIRPVDGSYVRGETEDGTAYAVHALDFQCDLPFPFSNYECVLHVHSRVNAAGEYETNIYSSSEDFEYMGGRDVFVELVDSQGDWVGYLAVRRFGFDLDGVPDGADDRREAMRGSLGNLKRNAERRFERSGGVCRDEVGRLPLYDLVGRRSE
ncbi:MAG: hypothetical protein R3F34_05470 [Planctomycetota bacterium]